MFTHGGRYGGPPIGLLAVDTDGSQLHTIVDPSVNSGRDDRWGRAIGFMTHFDISRDGRVAYSTCRYPGTRNYDQGDTAPYWEYSYEIVASNIDGTDMKRLTRNDHFDNFPAWSPDGSQIAFISDPDPTHNAFEITGRIVIYDMATGQSRDITLAIGDRVAPHPLAWSPDGRRIAFVAYEDEVYVRRGVYTIEADGSNLARISYAYSEPSWSPDGQRIALAVPNGAVSELYTFAPDGSEPIMVTRIAGGGSSFWLGRVSWSPDGSRIMFARPENHFRDSLEDSCRVCIATVDGSLVKDVLPLRLPAAYHSRRNPRRLPETLAWSPDGSKIAVQARATLHDPLVSSAWLLTIDRDGKDPRILVRDSGSSFVMNPEPVDVESCLSFLGVPDPEDNPGLVEDCRTLLDISETLGGSTLINLWEWVGVGGDPPRVHSIAIYPSLLYGQILPELGSLTELRILDLSSNELNGLIPPELGNMANLEVLRLRSNLLTGGIPLELGNLESLEVLDLRDNELTGRIPLELGNLESLEVLDLRDNELTGRIPLELGNLGNLRERT